MTNIEEQTTEATVIIWREGKWFVAYEPISGVASQGKTVDEALDNLKEALELYLEEGEEIHPLERVMITTIKISLPKKVVTTIS